MRFPLNLNFKPNIYLRKVNTIEFELKSFSKEFNQNKKTVFFSSPEYKYDTYNWSLVANVDKQSDNEFRLLTYLQCKSGDESNLPVNVLMNFFILNNEKDSRKDYKTCKCNLK